MGDIPRILGISVVDVDDWREPEPDGKWSRFFGALSRQAPVHGVVTPKLTPAENYLNLAFAARPNRQAWRGRRIFNPLIVAMRDRHIRDALATERGQFDVIMQLQTVCSPGPASLGVPYAIYTDNTMALTQRHYPSWAPISSGAAAAWERFEAKICCNAHKVFTFSEFARRSVIDDYGAHPDSVVAVGAGANQWVESPTEPQGPPQAIFVGEDFARKGGSVLLEAWDQVRRAAPGAELVIVGPRSDPVGTQEGVRWLGNVDRLRLDQLYRAANVFVLPSLFDPWGHVFVEAMGYGLPCIGTACCAMPELIVDGVTGRLVGRGNARALARALVELLTDQAGAAAMGAQGRRRVLTDFTWDAVAARVVQHLSA